VRNEKFHLIFLKYFVITIIFICINANTNDDLKIIKGKTKTKQQQPQTNKAINIIYPMSMFELQENFATKVILQIADISHI